MTTVVATPHPTTASVSLTITPTSSVTAINRTDANGTQPVRVLAGVLPRATPFVVTDYEAALGELVSYSVVDAGAGAATSTTLDTETIWLTLPIVPQFNAELELVEGIPARRESSTTVHEVIGRADPVPTLGVMRMRRGTARLFAPDYATALELVALLARGEVVQLRQAQHAGADMYFIVTATEVDSDPATHGGDRIRWHVAVDYVEQRRPAGPLLGSFGWTWDDVEAAHATWTDVTGTYATWNDLEVGP